MSAEKAARQILNACQQGRARLVIGAHTKAVFLLNEIMPGAMAQVAALANRLLPGPADSEKAAWPGHMNKSALTPNWLTRLSEDAARANNEIG